MESAPVVTDDTVFVGAGALDSESGEKLWGDLGNQAEGEYFYSSWDQNAAVEGPAVTDDAVFMATQYGLDSSSDGGRPMRRRAFLAAGGLALGAGCSGLVGDSKKEKSPPPKECAIDPSVTPGTAEWSGETGDQRNTGSVPTAEVPAPPLALDWTYTMDGTGAFRVPSSSGAPSTRRTSRTNSTP